MTSTNQARLWEERFELLRKAHEAGPGLVALSAPQREQVEHLLRAALQRDLPAPHVTWQRDGAVELMWLSPRHFVRMGVNTDLTYFTMLTTTGEVSRAREATASFEDCVKLMEYVTE